MSASKRCPLVNPLCPDDLCVLMAGHSGSDEGKHLLGTMPGSGAKVLDLADLREVSDVMYLAKPGLFDVTLIRLGRERQDQLLKDGTIQ